MSDRTVWVDTSAARTASVTWAARGDDLQRVAFDLAVALDGVDVDPTDAVHHLGAAAATLWALSGFLRLVVEHAERADVDMSDHRTIRQLFVDGGAGVTPIPARACLPTWAATTLSPPWGDLDDSGDAELRSPYPDQPGRTPLERARSLVTRALLDTGDATQIRDDEFQLVRLDSDKFVIVLPGVIDLSTPHVGWDDANRSARDLDQAAVASSRSTSVADNRYARLVWDGLRRLGVPPGADLMIVGHSFGSDTALDLAADPGFNGPGGYRVSHVVAAAYWSQPQLDHVPADTKVLVLQNDRDSVVISEAAADTRAVDALDNGAAALADLVSFDPFGAARHAALAWRHEVSFADDAAGFARDHARDVVRVTAGLAGADPTTAARGIDGLLTLTAGVAEAGPGHVVDVFDAGRSGGGHSQDRYIEHLEQVDEALVTRFLQSVDDAGFTGAGTAVAIDVSVPARGSTLARSIRKLES